MKVAILGAGAMGSVFGGHLALAGHDVTLVDLWREHMEAVAANGLDLRTPDGTSLIVPMTAIHDPSLLEPVELVIVLTKTFAGAEALRSIQHALTDGTWVATVQNGLGNDRRLAEVIGPERVVPGTTTVGAEQSSPGISTMSRATAARTSVTHLGPPRTGAPLPHGVKDVAATMTAAGLPTEALDSADIVIWTKLALAGPMGPLTALLRRTVSDVIDDEHGSALVRAMFDEIVAVAHATGVPLEEEASWEHALKTYRDTGPHTTSMAADVLAHRRTEIDAFCGEIARLGAANGVETPVNRVVWNALKAVEATYATAL
jgi:2-dehydropantoate 2-reductase